MKQTTQLAAALKVAAFGPLAAGVGIGGTLGYRNAGNSPEEKTEGAARGALRGGATMTGAGIGALTGARIGASGSMAGMEDRIKLLAALGLLGGGAAGYAASGMALGDSSADKKKERREKAKSAIPSDEF